jgi:hypothetical protein
MISNLMIVNLEISFLSLSVISTILLLFLSISFIIFLADSIPNINSAFLFILIILFSESQIIIIFSDSSIILSDAIEINIPNL